MTRDEQAPGLETLELRLGVLFTNRELLHRALTHHSYSQESREESYDRLEFLGDALIGVRVVEHLFQTYPDASEGELTALKSEVVSRRVLAGIGQRLGLMRFIRADVASLRTFNERTRESLSADVVEALVGAVYLDQGRAAAEQLVDRLVLPEVPSVRASLGALNPKGTLQQHVLRQTGQLPRYALLAEQGQQNDRRFVVGVYAGDRLLARGEGSSIKAAGREAARAALAGEHVRDDAAPGGASDVTE